MADAYLPNAHDRDVLREMVAWFRRTVRNTQGRNYTAPELGAPGNIVALAPSGGIPARDGTTLGSATCNLYRALDGELEALTDQTQTVYNLAPAIVPEGTYAPVIRDRFGVWYIQTSEIDLIPAHLVTDVCFSTQSVKKTLFMLPRASAGDYTYCAYEPSDCCDTPTTTGTGTLADSGVDCNCGGSPLVTPPATLYAVFCDDASSSNPCLHCLQVPLEYSWSGKFWYGEAGLGGGCEGVAITIYCHREPGEAWEMNVNYLWLQAFGNQQVVLNRDFGYTPDCEPFDYYYRLSVSDVGSTLLNGPMTIRVSENSANTCADCDAGTGTTPDDPTGPEPTPCCETTTLPGTLYATMSGCSSCSFTTLTLFYNSASGRWQSALSPSCGGSLLGVELYCEAGTGWRIDVNCDNSVFVSSVGLTAASCDPFVLSSPPLAGVAPCCDSGFTVTITE